MGCSSSKATQAAPAQTKQVEAVHHQVKKTHEPPAERPVPAPEEGGLTTSPQAVPTNSASTVLASKKHDEGGLANLPPPEELPGSVPKDSKIIFVLGGPGSGKGTQCDKLVQRFGYCHLSAGDLLRDEVKRGSALGKALDTFMKEGKLVPQGVTIALLRNAMIRSGKSSFLIDGFPRAPDQAHTFEEELMPPEAVIFFDCPQAVMEERLLSRGKTSGRSDDEIGTIKKRFVTYQESTLPVIELYRKKGKLIHVSAVPPPDEVFQAVVTALEGDKELKVDVAGTTASTRPQTEALPHQAQNTSAYASLPDGIPTPGPVTFEATAAALLPDKSIHSHVIRVTGEESVLAAEASEVNATVTPPEDAGDESLPLAKSVPAEEASAVSATLTPAEDGADKTSPVAESVAEERAVAA